MKNLLMALLLVVSSCNNKAEEQKSTEEKKENIKLESVSEEGPVKEDYLSGTDSDFDFNDKKLQENLKKAIYEGDIQAYRSASKQYIIKGRHKEFLYYAVLMAEKNHSKEAYSDIATILGSEPQDPLVKKYNYTSQYGTYSILKSYEMGEEGAKQSVNYMYTEKGKEIPKSSSIYCSK